MVLPKPDLKPRRGLLWTALAFFAAWVGLLTWIYVTQVWSKHA